MSPTLACCARSCNRRTGALRARSRRRAALLGRTDDAIAELDGYAARFGHGTLRKDAAAVRVSALCKAGREDDPIASADAAGLPAPRCR
jgi:hypothetical protein